MDHRIPKRRVPVSFWCTDRGAAEGRILLDLDPTGRRHPTILSRLNSPSRFIPVETGPDGRVELCNRSRWLRLVPGPDVPADDVFAPGRGPSREEETDVWLTDGSRLSGRIWMPLERPTQRLSDFVNQRPDAFIVLRRDREVQLLNVAAVARMGWAGGGDAPRTSRGSRMSGGDALVVNP